MKIFFDTEFVDDGKTVELISIGMVREDGATLYLENSDCDLTKVPDWHQQNVIPKLVQRPPVATTHADIKRQVTDFCSYFGKPEFWAYYASYDWICLCQLYGRMLDLPEGWPMAVNDLRWLRTIAGNPPLKKPANAHNALEDALWVRDTWRLLREVCSGGIVLPPQLE